MRSAVTVTIEPSLTSDVSTVLGPMITAPLMAPTAIDLWSAAGFDREDRSEWYYAYRAAPLGRASADTVIATFFNFNPSVVRRYVPRVWDIAEPSTTIELLLEVVDATMGEALADFDATPELRELADLLSAAAATAFAHPEGRPLFAGIAAIPWPEAPPAQVWLATHALREFRGDGHVAVLAAHGLSAREALVLHGGMQQVPPELLRRSRGWRREEWEETVDDLRSRGRALLEALGRFHQGVEEGIAPDREQPSDRALRGRAVDGVVEGLDRAIPRGP